MGGKIRNGPSWLGLNDDRTAFVFLEERARVMRQIFQLSISGLGGYTIAKLLNEQGVAAFGPSAKWDQSTIHNMLRNRATIGEYQKKERVNGKEVPTGKPIPNYYPAVIDQQTFDTAQRVRQQNLAERRGRKGRQITNLFADIPRCIYCGSGVKLHNAEVKSLICKKVWAKDGCYRFKWTYENFEKTFLALLHKTGLIPQLKPLLKPEASIQDQPANLYELRLSTAQHIRSVVLDLQIAFAGKIPANDDTSFIRRDHPDRFFNIVLSDGSSRICYPLAYEERKPIPIDSQKIGQQLGLSPRQASITAQLAQGETLNSIAKNGGMTVSTSRWHLREIFKRTGCRSQTELIELAKRRCPPIRETGSG
jgi:DNA-binding CsgD family transcriptional regulator